MSACSYDQANSVDYSVATMSTRRWSDCQLDSGSLSETVAVIRVPGPPVKLIARDWIMIYCMLQNYWQCDQFLIEIMECLLRRDNAKRERIHPLMGRHGFLHTKRNRFNF